jgi:hypothetical protein
MSENKRKLKSSGTTSEVSLDKTKEYKYDKSGALVVATTVGDNDIVFSGSKSSLRRISDLERNVSILAATLTTTDGDATDSDDNSFDGIFTSPARFKSTTRFDAAVDVRAAVAMNSNKITGLGTPSASGDAANKSYVDSSISALVASSPSTLDTLNELATALGNDANFSTTVTASIGTKLQKSNNLSDLTNAAAARSNLGLSAVASSGSYADLSGKPTIPTAVSSLTNDSAYVTAAGARGAVSFAAGSGAYNSTTGVISIPTNTNQLANGAGFITGYTETSTLAQVTARGATTTSALSTGALTVSGAITSTGEITAYYSDVNLKKDIVEIAGALDKVEAIRGVHYRPNEAALGLGIEDKAEVGVIAQEIEAVLPELVVASAFEGYKTVKYDKLTALLIEAVKELSAKVKTLEAQVGKQA